MPAPPPKTTLILYNIPDKCLLGIDLHFFTATAEFNGIKHIPDGIHVLHWSPPTPDPTVADNAISTSSLRRRDHDDDDIDIVALRSQSNIEAQEARESDNIVMSNMNLRMAVFFEASEGKTTSMTWHEEREEFVISERPIDSASLLRLYPHLLSYPNSSPEFGDLTSMLTADLLSTFLPASYSNGEPISSITASSTDSLLLNQAIADASSSRKTTTLVDDTESFRFLNFDLRRQRTWREGAIGRELTAAALDRSWFLGHLVSRDRDGDYDAVLAELQLCFVLVVLLANYSSAEQWKRIVELLCTCESAVSSHPDLYSKFLDTLYSQFQCVPEVYFADLLGSDFVTHHLRGLRKTLLHPFNRTFVLEDSSSSDSDIRIMTPDAKDAMLRQIFDIGQVLEERFGVDLNINSKSTAARRRRQSESVLGSLSGASGNGFERMHHYGSDDEDEPRGLGAVYDSDDAEEERGEYAPVIVEL
ncbi:A1 cistron-splicing factor [Lipomyces kononenkoae]|uniref:A1 cistron-splicing factor n=1 Tax=Lipomyces kononenkoae TaxID=34357 RepID=A0ACC3T9S8_LIPKO